MKYILLNSIKIYQKYISPFIIYKSCKYYPSCSEYATLSIKKYGSFIGLLYTIYRLLRCNPYTNGGVDYP